MKNFDEIIEDIEDMPIDSQEILIDILNKRMSERKREKFIHETSISRDEYVNGKSESGSSNELFEKLGI